MGEVRELEFPVLYTLQLLVQGVKEEVYRCVLPLVVRVRCDFVPPPGRVE